VKKGVVENVSIPTEVAKSLEENVDDLGGSKECSQRSRRIWNTHRGPKGSINAQN
jgi:hypothetical protein